MKYIFFLLLSFAFLNLKAQLPTGVPTQKINGWAEANYYVPDSGAVAPRRDTLWVPRFPGTMVTWYHAGVDTAVWFWNSSTWNKLANAGNVITQNIANASLKANGTYLQNWNHDQLLFDTVNWFQVKGFENDATFSTRKTKYTLKMFPDFGALPLDFSIQLRNIANNADSLNNGFFVSGNTTTLSAIAAPGAGTLFAQVKANANSAAPSIDIRSSNAASGASFITVWADSIDVSGAVPASTADSIFAFGKFKSANGSNKLLKIPIPVTGGAGTVTSVGLTMPTAFTVTSTSTNPITTSGTFNVTANGTSAQYIKGNGVLGTTDTSMIPSFFTKVRSLFSGTSPITYNSFTGSFGINNANTSGTKGASTFNNSDFSDDGAGLISLSNLSNGGCVNCQLTITKGRIASFADGKDTSGNLAVEDPAASTFLMNFMAGDTIGRLSLYPFDGSTSITQDSFGIHVSRAINTTNPWDNRILFGNYGQTWTNTWSQTITFTPNFDPSATVRQIGFGITNIGDNQLNPAGLYFGFMVKLGPDSSTSGYQGAVSSTIAINDYYAQRFFGGFQWAKGDVIRLNVRQSDRNQFLITLTNLTRNSKVSGYLNYPLPNSIVTQGYTANSGYPSMYFNGGAFTIRTYEFDPLTDGVQLVWVGNSIGYGYGLDSMETNNNYYTTYNKIRDSLPFRSVLLARPGVTTNDVNLIMKEIAIYKPKYVVLDGIQTNDYFVSHDTLISEATYSALVKRIKAIGINVIHIVPAPRGSVNPSQYGNFQPALKNWILATYPYDQIINDFDSLLRPGTTNTLDSMYFFTGDGTHLNVKGHGKRASDFLKFIQFFFYKNSTTRWNPDTLSSYKIYNDSLVNNSYALFQNNIKVRGVLTGNTMVINDSAGASIPLSISGNVAGNMRMTITNNNSSNSGAAGAVFANDINSILQIYHGSSSASGFAPNGVLFRESGTGGIKFSNDVGRMFFEQGLINSSGDSSHIYLELDSVTTRFKKSKISLGGQFATAYLHIKAGLATAGNAPLKLSAGTNLTTPEDGAIEYNGTHYYGTIGSTRYQLDQQAVSGITTLNTLTAATQTFAAGTSGSDFNISSSSSTHTFNIPSASASNRGLVTTSSQEFAGGKTFDDGIIVTSSTTTPRISITGNFSTASEPGIAGVELGIGNFTYTDNGASRTVSQGQNISLIGQPTITSGNAITYSGDASTVRFVGAPVAAGSMTISHPWNIFANNNNYISGIAFGLNEQNTSASLGDAAFNVFAGTTATYTLPALSTWPGKIYYIKNAGSGNLTVSRAGSDNLYTTTSVTTITVAAGASVVILAGSAFWYVM